MADGTPRMRVGNLMGGALIALAFLFDLIQFLVSFLHVVPWVGNAIAFVVALFITCFAYITFGIWFALLRVNYFTGKQAALKILTLIGTLGLELIPLIDTLPAITAGVITMVLVSRLEDSTGLKAKEMTAESLAKDRAKMLSAVASVVPALGSARALARTAQKYLKTPLTGQLINQQSDEELQSQNERAKSDEEKSPEYKRLREELSVFRKDAHRFTKENIDPSFYGIREERKQQEYRDWRSKTANVNALTRGKNIDVPKPKGPQPDTYQ